MKDSGINNITEKTTDRATDKAVDKTKVIRSAALIALIGNALLATIKIVVGFFSGSGALVADGIDSSADVLISGITLFVVRIIAKPADEEHPWGHGRAETVATALLSFVLFFVGAQLIVNSISNIGPGEQHSAPSAIAIIVTLISIAGKIFLAWSQYILGKRAESAMIKANAKNMAGDVMISGSVLIGLVISTFTGTAVADTVIAMLIGAWIIKTAIGIFLEVNLELMDGNSNIEPYQVIVDAVNQVEGAANPHRARMRRIAGFWDIDLDIDVDPQCSVEDAHDIACNVEHEIKLRLENVFDIMIHVEPRGDAAAETYGLSEDAMRRCVKNNCGMPD
ncbi:MAG: cation diffusion facilitator family transporter [Oscillospiraceae bacterium]|nr:cation diffusion facilitator family transporter [Oscillospiraceae bacterium]